MTLALPPVHAIAFDFAGTATTEERSRPGGIVVRDVLHREFDTNVPDEFVAVYDRSFWPYYVESLADTLPRLLSDTAAMCQVRLPDLTVLAEAIWKACGDHPVDPASADAIRTVHDWGVTCLLASNTARPLYYRQQTLQAVGLGFMTPVCSSDIGVAKPDAAFYEHIVRRAGCQPGQILFIGDNYLNDWAAPVVFGMQAVWVNRRRAPDSDPERLANGMWTIAHLSQLPDIFDAGLAGGAILAEAR